MRPSIVSSSLFVLTTFTSSSSALQALTNSPCALQCGNTLGSTSGADIVCHDSDYGTSAGIVFKNCISCQLGSTYIDPVTKQTDLQWALFNIRYAISWCLFGYPDNPDAGSSPCTTSFACGPIESGFEFDSLSPNASIYKFCALVPDVNVPKCKSCLALQEDEFFLTNFLTTLNAGCLQQPTPGNTISIDGSLFSETFVNITTPSATPLPYNGPSSGLTLGAKVGIAVGAILVFLFTVGCCIVCIGRRRRRKALAKHQAETGYANWIAAKQAGNPDVPVSMTSAGNMSAGGFHDSPQSQRPLFQGQSWGIPTSAISNGSPASAMGEKVYFSPYSSQYSSPVSAQDQVQPAAQWVWPLQAERERKGSAGGSSSALGRNRSTEKKPMQPEDGDRIEMHFVAPVLHHPPNGRVALTEDDAHRGQAI